VYLSREMNGMHYAINLDGICEN